MADSNKNILITPAANTANQPTIEFKGYNVNSNNIKLVVADDGSLSFEGGTGQLFSISDEMTGTIFSVNDISGIPSIEVKDDGTVKLAEFGGNVTVNGQQIIKYYEQADAPTLNVTAGSIWKDTDTGVVFMASVDSGVLSWFQL